MTNMIRSALSIFMVVLLVVPMGFAQPPERVKMPAREGERTAETPADPIGDGPHVGWGSRGRIVDIGYFCDGENRPGVVMIGGADTLRFTGWCNDFGQKYLVVAENPRVPPVRVDGVSRIMAVSDLHGEYDEFCDFLQHSDVIDDKLQWIWGEGHLVIVGDVFDRGDQVTECLWLIHQLEWQAREAGGAVHMLLGNHETIALRGDERYVNEKYLNGIVKSVGGEDYEYRRLFTPNMELGRWLRSKNAAMVINDILFVHGGISPELMRRKLSLEAINDAAREGIEYLKGDTTMPELPKLMHGSLGPMWYRGFQYGLEGRYPLIESAQLDSVLAFYGATVSVGGHSELDSVMSMHDGRTYFIDVPVDEIHGFEGLYWEAGVFYRVKPDGAKIRMN